MSTIMNETLSDRNPIHGTPPESKHSACKSTPGSYRKQRELWKERNAVKKLFLVTLLALLAFGVYRYLNSFTKSNGTPQATADAYMEAALKKDDEAIRRLCTPAAADDAVRIAVDIRSAVARNERVRFEGTQIQPPHAILTAQLPGEVIEMDLIDEGAGYRIVKIKTGDM